MLCDASLETTCIMVWASLIAHSNNHHSSPKMLFVLRNNDTTKFWMANDGPFGWKCSFAFVCFGMIADEVKFDSGFTVLMVNCRMVLIISDFVFMILVSIKILRLSSLGYRILLLVWFINLTARWRKQQDTRRHNAPILNLQLATHSSQQVQSIKRLVVASAPIWACKRRLQFEAGFCILCASTSPRVTPDKRLAWLSSWSLLLLRW